MLLVAFTKDLKWKMRFEFTETEWSVVQDKRCGRDSKCRLQHKSSGLQMIGESENAETVYAFEENRIDILSSVLEVICIVPNASPIVRER